MVQMPSLGGPSSRVSWFWEYIMTLLLGRICTLILSHQGNTFICLSVITDHFNFQTNFPKLSVYTLVLGSLNSIDKSNLLKAQADIKYTSVWLSEGIPNFLFFRGSWCKKAWLLVSQPDKPECNEGNRPELNDQCNNCSNNHSQYVFEIVQKTTEPAGRQQEQKSFISHKGMCKELGYWGTQLPEPSEGPGRHHLGAPAPTNSALTPQPSPPAWRSGREFMSGKTKIWFLMELYASSLNLLLSTFTTKNTHARLRSLKH